MTSFNKALTATLSYEGGYAFDPIDHGNETMYGITKGTALEFGYDGRMSALPLSLAEEIYRKKYWDRLRLDYISAHNEQLAITLFDVAVNMGVIIAGKFLQEAINLIKKGANIKVDGIIGHDTLNEIKSIQHDNDKLALTKMVEIQRGARYLAICKQDPSQEKYILGWLKRVNLGGKYGC